MISQVKMATLSNHIYFFIKFQFGFFVLSVEAYKPYIAEDSGQHIAITVFSILVKQKGRYSQTDVNLIPGYTVL